MLLFVTASLKGIYHRRTDGALSYQKSGVIDLQSDPYDSSALQVDQGLFGVA